MDPIEIFLEVVQRTTYKDIPPKTVDSVKSVLVDFFGVMLGGITTRQSRLCAEIVGRWGGLPEATVFASGRKVPLHSAVLANCTAGRALDYDDIHEQAHLHATVAVVPPALAISEITKINGSQFVVSIIIGFELLARIGLALSKKPGATGMSTTYQGATLASSLVGTKMLELEPYITRNALGIAYSQLAGTQQVVFEGVDLMAIQQGLSAMNGMIALDMARLGLTGPKEILCGKYGYFPVFHPERHDISAFTKDLGNIWEIENTSFKPFPCCKLTHTAVQSALDLRAEYSLSSEEIAEVQVGINDEDYYMVCEPMAIRRKPLTVIDAIYSMPYVISVALTKGKVGLEDFTTEAIKRPDVLDFTKIVYPIKDVNLPKVTDKGIPTWITITLKDGRQLKCYKEAIKGSPTIPMSKKERNDKFFNCLAYAGYPDKIADELVRSLENIENIKDISSLVKLCCLT